MVYCTTCGVELEKSMKFCPLCGKHHTDKTIDKPEHLPLQEIKHKDRLQSDFEELTPDQRWKLFWQLSGIILISGMVVTFIVNLIINQSVTWSKFSISTCLILFVNITLIVFFKKRIVVSLIGCFISTSILLVLFDMFNKNIGWGTQLGIPLVFSFYLVVYLLISLIRNAKQRGINLIAYFLIAAGILSLSVEGIISLQLNKRLSFEWSVITLVSVLTVSAILLFIHYRLKKGTDLKRFFHI